MTQANFLNIAKWPLLLADVLGYAGTLVWHNPHPLSITEAVLIIGLVIVGAVLGALPFILEYRAFMKVVEVNALGAAVDQIRNVETIGGQISSVTDQWGRMQEAMERHSAKTITSAREIAEKMAIEVREFNDFMQKSNDQEKATLRLEVDKLRRSEGEWLQVLVRILDHIYALHNAATRSGQPELAAQIGNFQNACSGVARRMGLAIFEAEPGKPFDAKIHQVPGSEKPAEGALILETVGAGYTYQGRLLRHAVVRLKTEEAALVEKTPFKPEPGDEE